MTNKKLSSQAVICTELIINDGFHMDGKPNHGKIASFIQCEIDKAYKRGKGSKKP